MIVLAQLHTKLLGLTKDRLDRLWSKFYQQGNGWTKLDAFFELPVWAARIQKIHPEPLHFYVIEDVDAFLAFLEANKPERVLMSVMDVNKHLITDIVTRAPNTQFVLGGYVSDLKVKATNYQYFETVEQYCEAFDLAYSDQIDLSVFVRYYGHKPAYIPRLTLSYGCTNLCKFCTVPSKILVRDQEGVWADAQSIIDNTTFSYVYLDDKTLGQASNYRLLVPLYNLFKANNQSFKGFIVQTTIKELVNKLVCDKELDDCIAYYEIGLEVFSDVFYQKYKKPITEKMFDLILQEPSLKNRIIYNVMIGVPGTTIKEYKQTLGLLKKHDAYVHHINIYNFSIYDNTELAQEQIKTRDEDAFEYAKIKSFHSQQDHSLVLQYYNLFLDYFKEKILKY